MYTNKHIREANETLQRKKGKWQTDKQTKQNSKQNKSKKTKDWATWIPPKTSDEMMCSGRVADPVQHDVAPVVLLMLVQTRWCYQILLLQNVRNYLKSRNVSPSCKAPIPCPALAILFVPFWIIVLHLLNKLLIFKYFQLEHQWRNIYYRNEHLVQNWYR